MESTYITAVHIQRVRHLTDIIIPLSLNERKNLILTGKNGSGKTSVLNSLCSHLADVVENSIQEHPLREICEQNIACYKEKVAQEATTEAERYAKQRAQVELINWQAKLKYWTEGVKIDTSSMTLLKEKYEKGEFILAFFGDTRKIKVETSRNIEKINPSAVYEIYDNPSRLLSKYMANLKTMQAFAQTEDDLERVEQIKDWFQRFEDILRRIYGDNSLKLKFDINTFQFSIYMNNREPFDFNTMSMGYAAVFDIIGSIMMRMESKRRYDLEGIVLIDEIETHLHVELQKEIIPILSELFPNLQFILTTHSPFILNSAKNSVVYDLEKHVLAENGLTNLPYSGIVEGYFSVDSLSQELRDKFVRYCQLIQKSTLSNHEYAEIAEIEMYLDEVPDYLALEFIDEYSRLKYEYHHR